MSLPDLPANTVVGRLSTSTGAAEAIPVWTLAIAMALAATSTTSLTIGTGTQTLTTQTSQPIGVGQILLVANTATPANYMFGQVTAYNAGTGSLTLNVTSTSGSGTYASWTITQSGPVGATGATGTSGAVPIGAAGGTVDAITSTITGVTLADQQQVMIVSAGANTSTTPTFAPNALTAHTITARGGGALGAGDIGAAGFVALMEYNLANTRWELLNPAASLRLSVGTTAGDIIYFTAAGVAARLPIGTAGQFLRTNVGATAPVWESVPSAAQTFLSGDVALNNASNYFNICNTGSIGLSGQVWKITACASASDSATAATLLTRIWDGSAAVYAESGNCISFTVSASGCVTTIVAIVTLSAATTFHLSCKSTSTTTTVQKTGAAGTANKASWIIAERIS